MSAAFSITYKRGTSLAASHARLLAPAIARGLNRTATSERAALSTVIAADMGLKVRDVKAAIRIKRATRTALVARVICSGRVLPLILFGAKGPTPSRGRGNGVTAKNPHGAGRYPHAFIATVGAGHRGVFQRVNGAKRRGPKLERSQLPIRELYGPSIVYVFTKYIPLGEARRAEVQQKNVAHEIDFALTKKGA